MVLGAGLFVALRGEMRAAMIVEVGAAAAAGLVAAGLGLSFRTKETIGLAVSDLLKKSAVFNLYSFIGTLYDRFDVLLLSKLAGEYATGIYSVAYRVLGMTQILAYGVLYYLFPPFSRNSGAFQ